MVCFLPFCDAAGIFLSSQVSLWLVCWSWGNIMARARRCFLSSCCFHLSLSLSPYLSIPWSP
ncbi:hypothetical protein BJX68DRAFT_238009 [Aspergillus pseudodeflectus]|uniref:Uncharacterized protein n=1 Tax=Aspergillus pseudodeflectus TaxID=176178 RepID=A0ABR4KAU9_9EURO